jgi:putative transposase
MPRTKRVVLPGFPHHIVQRGHNRSLIFAERADYERYLIRLQELKDEYRVKVYAFCLMTNHVHLLLAPWDRTGIASLMKRLAGRHTQRHNLIEGRSGTLWEGRYRSSLVQDDDYLLACCRYIELNPVRARMVAEPDDYPWSSCRYRLGSDTDDLLDLDPAYLALGATDNQRQVRYRDFLRAAIPTGEWELIRDAVQRGQLTGNARFRDAVAEIVGRRMERRGRGRPKRGAR